VLSNAYHLYLRPGVELVRRAGGLHQFMGWPKPILTDSGGFQVFSMGSRRKVDAEGVRFRSHIDGSEHRFTPEVATANQEGLGADIIMCLDQCIAYGSSREEVRAALERTHRWALACHQAHAGSATAATQALFGIVQGGTDLDQRTWCAERVTQHDLPGYAIGGVAVGEGYEGLKRVVQHTAPLLPDTKPRYLMGVGYERDLLTAVRAGVDMFDCVLPTRNGRNANAFTPTGQVRLKNARFARDEKPIDPACDCPACGAGFSRSYLRHLFMAGEMLGPILVSVHNIRHYHRFMLDIRKAIAHNDWSALVRAWPVCAGA
jgi:queuine tRNA-ribosyltransferase